MIILGLSGKRGTGKDTLADILVKKYGFIKLPFAEALKEGVRRDFNLTRDHTDGALKEVELEEYMGYTPRSIMIDYGQFFRGFDSDFWVKKVFDKIKFVQQQCDMVAWENPLRVVISDVRFTNEADYIKENGGLLARLERKSELNIYKTEITDASETDLDDYSRFDFTITKDFNLTPKSLEKFADNIMNSIEDLIFPNGSNVVESNEKQVSITDQE